MNFKYFQSKRKIFLKYFLAVIKKKINRNNTQFLNKWKKFFLMSFVRTYYIFYYFLFLKYYYLFYKFY